MDNLENKILEAIGDKWLTAEELFEILEIEMSFQDMLDCFKTILDITAEIFDNEKKQNFKNEYDILIKFMYEIIYCNNILNIKNKPMCSDLDMQRIFNKLQKWKIKNKEKLIERLDYVNNEIQRLTSTWGI